MTTETKSWIPGIQISWVRWLYDGKEHQWMEKNGHNRGSVIASLPIEALRSEVIRNGIVMDSILYTAQLWSLRAQVKQCFNCSQWGHTQASYNCDKEMWRVYGHPSDQRLPEELGAMLQLWQGPLIVTERDVSKLRGIQDQRPAGTV